MLVGLFKRFTDQPWSYPTTRNGNAGERKNITGTFTEMVAKDSYKRHGDNKGKSHIQGTG